MALGLKYKTQWLNCGYNIICMNFVQCLLKSFYFSKNLHHYNNGLYNKHKNKHVTRYQFTILSFINHWFLCSLVFECPIYLICSQVVKNIKIIINLHFQRKFPPFQLRRNKEKLTILPQEASWFSDSWKCLRILKI